LLAFFLDTGARLSEVAALTLPDLDLENGVAKVHGKGNRERLVFFHHGAEKELRAWLSERGDWEGEVFGLTPRGIQMLFARIRIETGLPVHVHLLRHISATMMLRSGADIHQVKRILGHKQLSTVEKYLSLTVQDVKERHSSTSPFEQVSQSIASPPGQARRRRLNLN
jgi:site-specific recombinase XerD